MADRDSRQRLSGEAARLARVLATPFYLFDRRLAAENLRAWRAAGGKDGELFYPWKCNRHSGLLALAARAGWGAEVTAREDLAAALTAGLSGGRVLFQGPAKDSASIDAALASGAWLAADGTEDARAILLRARELRITPRYLLRLRPSSAQWSQRPFGMSRAEAVAFGRLVARERLPAPEGLAFHLGTGLASLDPYVAAIEEAGRVAAALAADGIAVRTLDAGGGFAARGESRLDGRGRPRGTGAPAARVVRTLRAAARRALPAGVRLFLEPGRAVASDAFHLATRVVRVTPGRVYVDASRMSHGFFVPRGRHPFWPSPRRSGSGRVAVAGPLASDLDVFSAAEAIGSPREGDLLVIGSVGAYNLIAANDWAGRIPDVVEVSARASAGGRRSCGRTRR